MSNILFIFFKYLILRFLKILIHIIIIDILLMFFISNILEEKIEKISFTKLILFIFFYYLVLKFPK
jgi:hypothetical protein